MTTLLYAHLLIWLLTRSTLPLNVDYLLLVALAIWLQRRWFLALGTIITLAHISLLLYYLDKGISAFDLAEMLVRNNRLRLYALAICAGLLMSLAVDHWLGRSLSQKRRWLTPALLLATVVPAYAAYKLGAIAEQPVFSPTATWVKRLPDPSWRVWISAHVFRRSGNTPLTTPSLAYRQVLEHARTKPEGIWLMHVESWGLPRRGEQMKTLLDELGQRHPSHRFTLQSEPFESFTLPNEMRVLCNLRMGSLYFRSDSTTARDCLPQLLAEKGWTTLAVHNNEGGFYHRKDWYPAIGFARFIDRDQLAVSGASSCKLAFDTPCDRDVASYLAQLRLPPLHFVYWMSIDAHPPVMPASQIMLHDKALPESRCDLADDDCAAAVQWQLARQSVVDFFQLTASHPRSVLIAKGDHRPYFYLPDKGRYSLTEVPVVMAIPLAAPP